MKRFLAALAVAGVVGFGAAPASATTVAYLTSQGFEIQSVLISALNGEREVYLQRRDAVFVCRIRVATPDLAVEELGCRQISPIS